MLLKTLRQDILYFFKKRTVDVHLKTNKDGDYTGLDLVHKDFKFFKPIDKKELMYTQTIPKKYVNAEVACKGSFISIIIDSVDLKDPNKQFIDIYKYDLDTRQLKSKRSEITIP